MIKILVLFVDNVFFLGHGELEKAKNFHKSSKKLIYFPFSVDTDFWTKDSKLNSKDNIAIAPMNIPLGSEIKSKFKTQNDIPFGHKISLTDISKGDLNTQI